MNKVGIEQSGGWTRSRMLVAGAAALGVGAAAAACDPRFLISNNNPDANPTQTPSPYP